MSQNHSPESSVSTPGRDMRTFSHITNISMRINSAQIIIEKDDESITASIKNKNPLCKKKYIATVLHKLAQIREFPDKHNAGMQIFDVGSMEEIHQTLKNNFSSEATCLTVDDTYCFKSFSFEETRLVELEEKTIVFLFKESEEHVYPLNGMMKIFKEYYHPADFKKKTCKKEAIGFIVPL